MSIDEQPMNVYWSGKRTGLIKNYRINNKNSVDTYDDLPNENNVIGDMYTVTEISKKYIWNGLTWDEVDFDIYDYNNIINIPDFALDDDVVHITKTETITGVKTFSATKTVFNGDIVKNDNEGQMRLSGGTNPASAAYGANLNLFGSERSSSPGIFILSAGTSSSLVTRLIGHPDGTLTWGGQPIQTSSDEKLKTSLACVPDAVLDAWEEVQWGQFKYLDAVERKGESARLHLGLIAQKVKAVFEQHNLDACEYGILCYEEEEDLWMVRYTEALAMEAACQKRRADKLEMRIAILEEKLK